MSLERYLGHEPVVHPEAWVHPSAVLIGEVVVGPESTIWPHTTLRGDDGRIVIGARTSVQDGSVLHATEGISETVVGDCVTVGHRAVLHGARVGDHCIVGMGAILLDNVRVGDHCLIGAGTLVTQNVEIPPYSLVLGSPGRVVRRLTDEELSWIEYSWQRYVQQNHIHRGL